MAFYTDRIPDVLYANTVDVINNSNISMGNMGNKSYRSSSTYTMPRYQYENLKPWMFWNAAVALLILSIPILTILDIFKVIK